MFRRDRDRVGRLRPEVVGLRTGDSRLLRELVEERRDVGERGRRVRPGGVRRGRRLRRKRELVDRVRRRIVRGHLARVPHDLRITRIRLQLQPAAAVVRDPEAPGRAREKR